MRLLKIIIIIKTSSIDYRCRTKPGKFLWYSDSHRYLRNAEGNVEAIIGCLRDITDLKVVEILKSTSKERLSMAMEAASDCIWEWKVPSNRLFLDANFYNILGYEPYEFADNFIEWENRMHPDDRKTAMQLLKIMR
ncbi:MAG: PAS domain-containing protein [Bacteroidales bacterium]|nr:PAS domain-containing protein [Bacteroidales bacterium]